MIEGNRHGVKDLTLSYMVIALAPGTVMVQILGVRWVGLVACFVAPMAWAAPRSSNPAFLGVRMDAGGNGPCRIMPTPETPAEAAGLEDGDFVIAIDGKPIKDCVVLLDEITAHAPGDAIQIKVQRPTGLATVQVQLTTRDALLQNVVGKPMVGTELMGVEDETTYDLSALHGRMAIVGLYNPACVDCATLFTKFLDWSRAKARKGEPQALVLAVSVGEPIHDLKALQNTLDVPLATGDLIVAGRDLISDRDRLGVIVIDGCGIVEYLGPVAPNSDDTEAVLDELFAAAEQAARRSK